MVFLGGVKERGEPVTRKISGTLKAWDFWVVCKERGRPRDRIPDFLNASGFRGCLKKRGGAVTKQNSGILKAWDFLVFGWKGGGSGHETHIFNFDGVGAS